MWFFCLKSLKKVRFFMSFLWQFQATNLCETCVCHRWFLNCKPANCPSKTLFVIPLVNAVYRDVLLICCTPASSNENASHRTETCLKRSGRVFAWVFLLERSPKANDQPRQHAPQTHNNTTPSLLLSIVFSQRVKEQRPPARENRHNTTLLSIVFPQRVKEQKTCGING